MEDIKEIPQNSTQENAQPEKINALKLPKEVLIKMEETERQYREIVERENI